MKTQTLLKTFYGTLLFIIIGIALACNNSNNRFENNLADRDVTVKINGIASSGTALGNRKVTITHSNKTQNKNVVTASNGTFVFELKKFQLPAIVEVERTPLSPLMTVIAADVNTDVTVHINPITTRVAQTTITDLDNYSQQRSLELGTTLANIESATLEKAGTTYVEQLLGGGVPFTAFYNDSEFKARRLGNYEISSVAGMILETLEEWAIRKDATSIDIMTLLENEPTGKHIEDYGFLVELSANMIGSGFIASDSKSLLDSTITNSNYANLVHEVNQVMDNVKTPVSTKPLTNEQKIEVNRYTIESLSKAVLKVTELRSATTSTFTPSQIINIAQNIGSLTQTQIVDKANDLLLAGTEESLLIQTLDTFGQNIGIGASYFKIEEEQLSDSHKTLLGTIVTEIEKGEQSTEAIANTVLVGVEDLSPDTPSEIPLPTTTSTSTSTTSTAVTSSTTTSSTTTTSTSTTGIITTTSTTTSPPTTDCRNPYFPPVAGDNRPPCEP